MLNKVVACKIVGKMHRAVVVSVALTALIVSVHTQTPKPLAGVNVMKFGYLSTGKSNWQMGEYLRDQLINQLLAQGVPVAVRDWEQMIEILGEGERGQSGVIDPETAARIGKKLGVQYLVLGSVQNVVIKKKDFIVYKEHWIEATIDYKVLDVNAGSYVHGKIITGKSGVSRSIEGLIGKELDVVLNQGNINDPDFAESKLSESFRDGVKQIAEDIVKQVPSSCTVRAKVTPSSKSEEFMVAQPLKIGTQYKICLTTGVTQVGDHIYEETQYLGDAEVIDVQGSVSRLKIVRNEMGSFNLDNDSTIFLKPLVLDKDNKGKKQDKK
jgi:hypothetical protein